MDPLAYRLALYTGNVSRQIMAHQVREVANRQQRAGPMT
jgi:hypothetical protein